MGDMDYLFGMYSGDDDDDSPSRNIECKRCGKSGLHWEDDNGRWRLLTAKGAAHVCEPAACEFEDLTKEG